MDIVIAIVVTLVLLVLFSLWIERKLKINKRIKGGLPGFVSSIYNYPLPLPRDIVYNDLIEAIANGKRTVDILDEHDQPKRFTITDINNVVAQNGVQLCNQIIDASNIIVVDATAAPPTQKDVSILLAERLSPQRPVEYYVIKTAPGVDDALLLFKVNEDQANNTLNPQSAYLILSNDLNVDDNEKYSKIANATDNNTRDWNNVEAIVFIGETIAKFTYYTFMLKLLNDKHDPNNPNQNIIDKQVLYEAALTIPAVGPIYAFVHDKISNGLPVGDYNLINDFLSHKQKYKILFKLMNGQQLTHAELIYQNRNHIHVGNLPNRDKDIKDNCKFILKKIETHTINTITDRFNISNQSVDLNQWRANLPNGQGVNQNHVRADRRRYQTLLQRRLNTYTAEIRANVHPLTVNYKGKIDTIYGIRNQLVQAGFRPNTLDVYIRGNGNIQQLQGGALNKYYYFEHHNLDQFKNNLKNLLPQPAPPQPLVQPLIQPPPGPAPPAPPQGLGQPGLGQPGLGLGQPAPPQGLGQPAPGQLGQVADPALLQLLWNPAPPVPAPPIPVPAPAPIPAPPGPVVPAPLPAPAPAPIPAPPGPPLPAPALPGPADEPEVEPEVEPEAEPAPKEKPKPKTDSYIHVPVYKPLPPPVYENVEETANQAIKSFLSSIGETRDLVEFDTKNKNLYYALDQTDMLVRSSSSYQFSIPNEYKHSIYTVITHLPRNLNELYSNVFTNISNAMRSINDQSYLVVFKAKDCKLLIHSNHLSFESSDPNSLVNASGTSSMKEVGNSIWEDIYPIEIVNENQAITINDRNAAIPYAIIDIKRC